MDHLASLTAPLPVEVRTTQGRGDGLFTTEACEPDSVLLMDVPLSWLPSHSAAQRAVVCEACGAFVGSPGEIISRLAGDAKPLRLPDLDAAPPHNCRRPQHLRGISHRSDEVAMAAQLVGRLVAAHGRAKPAARGKGKTAAWRAELEALASPRWEAVSDDEPGLAAAALGDATRALVAAGCAEAHVVAVMGTEGVWSRAMGAVARNAMWAQVPNPLVYYLAAFDEALRGGDAACAAALPRFAAAIERLMAARAAAAEERGRKRPREEEAHEEDEENDDEDDDDDDDDDGAVEEETFTWQVPASRGRAARRLIFSTALFPPSRGTALYPLASKVNHSCDPNCLLLWAHDCAVRLVATRPLAAGEELTIDYLANGDEIDGESSEEEEEEEEGESEEDAEAEEEEDGDDDEDDEEEGGAGERRRRWLLKQYGFECRCTRCEDELRNE